MTILDSSDTQVRVLAQIAFALQMLLKVEQAISVAMSTHPSRKQMELLAEADGLLGRAAHDIAQAGIVLRRLENRR